MLWQDLAQLTVLKAFDKHLAYFDSVTVNSAYLGELLSDNPVHLAFYPHHKFLIAFNLKERADEKSIEEQVNAILNVPKLKTALKDGIICVSNDSEILQNAFDVNRAKILNNKQFAKLEQETNYSGTRIFMNSPENLLPNCSMAAITLKPENIALNGLALTDSLAVFGNSNTKALSSYDLLHNIPLVCNEFEIKCAEFNSPAEQDWWRDINEAALFNASKQFRESIGDYLIIPRLPSGEQSVIIEITDTALVNDVLPYMCDTAEIGKAIKKLRGEGNFIASTFPSLAKIEAHYVLLVNDHLIATKLESDAQIFLSSAVNNTSILDNSEFATYASKNFDLDYHYLSYKAINTLPKKNIPLGEFITGNEKQHLKNVSHYSMTGIYKNGLFNFRINLKYFQENVSSEPNVLWTLNTDLPLSTAPFAFVNHVTKAKEIAYQLKDKSLVLQSATGKIIWTKKLKEEIKSEIFTVDAFKNGKNQLLFNSENYLHLIDRNGNYVQGYPVKLPAKATNRLTMFDYEKTRDYRLFIACADNRIYNYSIWGIKQEGFKTFPVSGKVVLPLRYCKVGLSDYLITADVKGKIYAFSRKGEGRIDFKNKLLENATEFEIVCGSNLASTQLIYYDEKNFLLNKISLADKKEVFKTSEFSGSITQLFVDYDKNSTTDFLVLAENTFQVYDASGLKFVDEKFEEPMTRSKAVYFKTETKAFISTLDSGKKMLTMRNIEQKTEKRISASQLPLITDLFNDGKLYAVIAEDKIIRCVKL